MNYNRQTKAQLIERISELETQTTQYKFDNFILELQLFLEDLMSAFKYFILLGIKARSSYQQSYLPSLVDELRTSLTSIYEERTPSNSESSKDALVLLPGETRTGVSTLLAERRS
ncbi:hypothetical protein N8654_03115, partial [Synechococcus sp. AH-601-B19]|nr:hypothetical protein [Synechococcus sp. AH-601-B19]